MGKTRNDDDLWSDDGDWDDNPVAMPPWASAEPQPGAEARNRRRRRRRGGDADPALVPKDRGRRRR